MREEVKLAALRSAFGQDGRTKGSEIIFFCPKHGSRAGRSEGQLSVNLKNDQFNCWSCGFSGKNIAPLLKLRGPTKALRQYVGELEEQRKDSRRCQVVVLEKEYDPPALPPEFKSLSVPSKSPYFRAALAYLAKRGLTTDDLLRWKLGYCEHGEMAGRIIIPSFDETGMLNFVVGRSFYEDNLRYKPYPKHQCKDLVWNDYMIDWEQPVTITEGPFDAFIVEENVTILQGTNMPESLIRKVVLSGTDVYFAMDADAFKRQLGYIELFLSYGVPCWYVDVKGRGKKDPGAMTKEFYRECRAASKPVRNELDILKMRVLA